MSNKITWREVYEDFKRRNPNSRDSVADYRPHDYMTIIIWFKDGTKATYNYLTKQTQLLVD